MTHKWPDLFQLMQINKAAHYQRDDNLPQGYKIKHSSDSLGFSKKGYYGIALVNDDNQQIIICNAGTRIEKSNLKNIFYDFASNWQIANSELPDQYKYALSFAKYSLETLPSNYNVTITGYSLGAVLTDLTTYTLMPNYFSRLNDVTFENPGSLEIIIKNLAGNNVESILNVNSKFHVYNAQSNIINIFGQQIGKEARICLDETKFSETFMDNKVLNHLVDGHLFENFMAGAFYGNGDIRFCDKYDWFFV